jgi:hypothetical protein
MRKERIRGEINHTEVMPVVVMPVTCLFRYCRRYCTTLGY